MVGSSFAGNEDEQKWLTTRYQIQQNLATQLKVVYTFGPQWLLAPPPHDRGLQISNC